MAGILERDLMAGLLQDSDRSALFVSQSRVVQKHYEGHRIYFFYLHTGDEIARMEVPHCVPRDGARLNVAHALALTQCQRVAIAPVALSEAHEQAVVTSADREVFWQLLEDSLLAANISATASAKSRSKRTRWL